MTDKKSGGMSTMKKTPKAVKQITMDTKLTPSNWREFLAFCVKHQTPLKKKGKVWR